MKTLPEMTVKELMNSKFPLIKETVSLVTAIHMMDEKNVSSLIVEKEHPQDAYGILTRKDIVMEAGENWDGFQSLVVRDLASKPLITIPSSVGIKHAIRLMNQVGVRRLGVLEGDKMVGVLSNSDIFKAIRQGVKKPA